MFTCKSRQAARDLAARINPPHDTINIDSPARDNSSIVLARRVNERRKMREKENKRRPSARLAGEVDEKGNGRERRKGNIR